MNHCWSHRLLGAGYYTVYVLEKPFLACSQRPVGARGTNDFGLGIGAAYVPYAGPVAAVIVAIPPAASGPTP